MAGIYITYANYIFLAYFIAGVIILHITILKEEKMLNELFGDEYISYKNQVGRYF